MAEKKCFSERFVSHGQTDRQTDRRTHTHTQKNPGSAPCVFVGGGVHNKKGLWIPYCCPTSRLSVTVAIVPLKEPIHKRSLRNSTTFLAFSFALSRFLYRKQNAWAQGTDLTFPVFRPNAFRWELSHSSLGIFIEISWQYPLGLHPWIGTFSTSCFNQNGTLAFFGRNSICFQSTRTFYIPQNSRNFRPNRTADFPLWDSSHTKMTFAKSFTLVRKRLPLWEQNQKCEFQKILSLLESPRWRFCSAFSASCETNKGRFSGAGLDGFSSPGWTWWSLSQHRNPGLIYTSVYPLYIALFFSTYQKLATLCYPLVYSRPRTWFSLHSVKPGSLQFLFSWNSSQNF